MKKNRVLLCFALSLLLGSCSIGTLSSSADATSISSSVSATSSSSSATSVSSSSESTSEKTSASTSEATSSASTSEKTSSSSSEATSASSSSSSSQKSSESSYMPVPGDSAWSLTGEALPPTDQSQYCKNVDFSVKDGAGRTVGFHGNNIRRAAEKETKGKDVSVAGSLVVRASRDDGDYGYFYQTSGGLTYLSFTILRNVVSYGGESYDYSGVPSLYVGTDVQETGGEKVELPEPEVVENGKCYEYNVLIMASSFRFANESENAIYIFEMRNLA